MRTLLLIGIPLVILRTIHIHHTPSPLTIDHYASKRVEILGTIVEEPDRRSTKTYYVIETKQIILLESGTILYPVRGRVRITDRKNFPSYDINDHINASGTLKLPEPIEDFRYDHYLSRFNIFVTMPRASIALHRQHMHPSLRSTLFRWKQHIEHRIQSLYGTPHAALLSGLLLGTRQDIPRDLMEAFNITGLTHIIAISGYNISLIILILGIVVWWMPHVIRFVIMTICITLFVLVVGASASVVRAAIMGILGLLAFTTGNQRDAWRLIVLTALIMLIHNPRLLWADVSFQLSFLAVIGLLTIAPTLKVLLKHVPEGLFIKDAAIMTLSAQLATGPLVAMQFGRISLIAPMANILITLAIPVVMILGPLSLIISPLCVLVFGCLHWIITVAITLHTMPLAAINTELGWIGCVFSYITMLFLHKYVQTFLPPVSTIDSGSLPGIANT